MIIGLFLFSVSSYAQTNTQSINDGQITKQPRFWWGPKAGLDLFTATTNVQDIEAQIKSNYQIGLLLQFGRKLYFQPEFYYAIRKESYEGVEEITVNTLKVPLMLGVRLFNIKILSAHLMAGPTISYLLNTSETDSDRKKSNFALQAGAGVDVLGFITLDVRYSVDLSGNVQEQMDQLKWNSGVNVTLGLKFR